MSSVNLRSLLIRGATIQQTIEREQARPHPDGIRLLQLKMLRLAIKERLYRIGRTTSSSLGLASATSAPRHHPRSLQSRSL